MGTVEGTEHMIGYWLIVCHLVGDSLAETTTASGTWIDKKLLEEGRFP